MTELDKEQARQGRTRRTSRRALRNGIILGVIALGVIYVAMVS